MCTGMQSRMSFLFCFILSLNMYHSFTFHVYPLNSLFSQWIVPHGKELCSSCLLLYPMCIQKVFVEWIKTNILILFTLRQGKATTAHSWNSKKRAILRHWVVHSLTHVNKSYHIALGFGDTVVSKEQSSCTYGSYNLVGKTMVNTYYYN